MTKIKNTLTKELAWVETVIKLTSELADKAVELDLDINDPKTFAHDSYLTFVAQGAKKFCEAVYKRDDLEAMIEEMA